MDGKNKKNIKKECERFFRESIRELSSLLLMIHKLSKHT